MRISPQTEVWGYFIALGFSLGFWGYKCSSLPYIFDFYQTFFSALLTKFITFVAYCVDATTFLN